MSNFLVSPVDQLGQTCGASLHIIRTQRWPTNHVYLIQLQDPPLAFSPRPLFNTGLPPSFFNPGIPCTLVSHINRTKSADSFLNFLGVLDLVLELLSAAVAVHKRIDHSGSVLQPPTRSEDERGEGERGGGREWRKRNRERGNKEGGRERDTQRRTEQHLSLDHGKPILFSQARYSTGVKMAGVSSRMARWIL